jgi:2-dehydro-3-deoxyglucarate aldolase/4-hydroxy-2-oxoheptanedioate aldolase
MNKLKQELLSNKPVIGVTVVLNEPRIIELLQIMDFVMIDTEHSPKDYQHVDTQILAAKAYNVYSLVRVPYNEPYLTKRILEMGPDGIVFPDIVTVEDAKKAIASCIYPPNGIRGYGPQRIANFGYIPQKQYLEEASDMVCRIIMIEHKDCIANLEKILEVPYIDACVIGLNDLSASIGQLGNAAGKDTGILCETALKKCAQAKIPIGIGGFNGFNLPDVQIWLDRGFRMIFASSDCDCLVNGAKQCVQNVETLYNNLSQSVTCGG